VLGGITLIVTLIADTGQHATTAPEPTPGPRIRVLAPPPIDAGVAPLDAPPLDAAPLTTDAALPPAEGG
jgi:hypothetical protein